MSWPEGGQQALFGSSSLAGQEALFDGGDFRAAGHGGPEPWLSDDDMSEDQLRDALGGSWAVEEEGGGER